MLTADERSALLLGRFSARCRSIAVKPANPNEDIAYDGEGEVFRNRGGKLEFSLRGRAHFPETFLFPRNPPGSLTYPHELPILAATDESGREWRGNLVNVQNSDLGQEARVSGTIGELRTSALAPADAPDLRLLIPGDFALPVSRWGFGDGDIELMLTAPEGGLQVDVSGRGPLPRSYDSRIEEALWLITGTISTSILVESAENGVLSTVLSSQTFAGTPSLFGGALRPLPTTAVHLAEMFLRYLRYVMEGERGERGERFHATSADLRIVHCSAKSTIEQAALAVSVAVEAFLRREHPDGGVPTSETSRALRAIEQYVSEWPGSPAIRDRVLTSIRRMRAANPRSALRDMATSGPLLPIHFEAWEQIRHAFAHGLGHQTADHRELIQRAQTVYQALLLLILDHIGYAGPLTDRTKPGWPTVAFPLARQASAGDTASST